MRSTGSSPGAEVRHELVERRGGARACAAVQERAGGVAGAGDVVSPADGGGDEAEVGEECGSSWSGSARTGSARPMRSTGSSPGAEVRHELVERRGGARACAAVQERAGGVAGAGDVVSPADGDGAESEARDECRSSTARGPT